MRTSVPTAQLRDVLTSGGLPRVSCVNRHKDRLRVSQSFRASDLKVPLVRPRHLPGTHNNPGSRASGSKAPACGNRDRITEV